MNVQMIEGVFKFAKTFLNETINTKSLPFGLSG